MARPKLLYMHNKTHQYLPGQKFLVMAQSGDETWGDSSLLQIARWIDVDRRMCINKELNCMDKIVTHTCPAGQNLTWGGLALLPV